MDEVPKELFGEIQFVFVENVQQVFREALLERVNPPATGAPPRPKPVAQPAPASSH
nr:hypothetical protein [Pyrinomonadaceae bacterium]